MFDNNIYRRPKDKSSSPSYSTLESNFVKSDPEMSIRNQDDEKFCEFVSIVNRTADLFEDQEPIKPYKLERIWFFSETFIVHWHTATKETAAQMSYCCFLHRLCTWEVTILVFAWMTLHGRRIGEAEIAETEDLIEKVWKNVQPALNDAKNKSNRRRRKRRRYQTMSKVKFAIDEPEIQPKKKGRPRQTGPDSLHNRILEELKKGRSTPKKLAFDLKTSRDAIDFRLKQMVAVGEVERVPDAWGLYASISI